MEQVECGECGMPMEKEEDKCQCGENICKYCCACEESCVCGCKQGE